MNYGTKSMTQAGLTMLAQAKTNAKAVIFDSMIVSERVLTTAADVTKLTAADFTNALTYPISSKSNVENSFTVKAVVTNEPKAADPVKQDFKIALVGVTAHIDGSDDSQLVSIAVGEDPAVLTAFKDTEYSLTFGVTQIYANASDIDFKLGNVAYALASDLDKVRSDVEIIINEKLKDVAKTSVANNFTKQQTLSAGAVDGKGNAYATTKDVATGLNNGLSTKVTDNKNGTITANNLTYDLSKTGLTPLSVYKSGSFNDLPLGTVFTDPPMTDGPDTINSFTTTTFLSNEWGGRKAQIAIADSKNLMYFRVGTSADTGTGTDISWNSWVLLSDDSKAVHSTDMRKPASDVAGIEEVNAKQDKIGYTPADDSKVVHSTVTQLNSTDMNTVLTTGFYTLTSGTNGMPNADAWTIYQVITLYSNNGVQLAYGTNNAILGMRSWNLGVGVLTFSSWIQFADDSKVVHQSDMRVPSNTVISQNELSTGLNSKVTDNKNGTEQLNGVQVQPYNKLSDVTNLRNIVLQTDNIVAYTAKGGVGETTQDFPLYSGFSSLHSGTQVYYSYDLVVKNADGGVHWLGWALPWDAFVSNQHITTDGIHHFQGTITIKAQNITSGQFIHSTIDGSHATYQITNLMIVVGSIPVTHLPAPEDKQDKIGYTPADDSKVMHRNPATGEVVEKLYAPGGITLAGGHVLNISNTDGLTIDGKPLYIKAGDEATAKTNSANDKLHYYYTEES